MENHLVAPCRQPTQPLGIGIRQPDLGEKIGCSQRGQDLVGFEPGVRDRLHLKWVGDDHACNVRAQHRTAAIALPVAAMTTSSSLLSVRPKAFQRRSCHPAPASRTQPAIFPKHHLAKGSVDIRSDHPSHLPSFRRQREQWATRHLRIRARGATGQVAGAASYHHELAAHQWIGLPTFRASGALVPNGRTTRQNLIGPNQTWDTAIFIPVTNP
jgi:hypothetical protein